MSKTPSELAHKLAQECVSKAPVLILGSGASAAYGIPGMPGLQNHLMGIAAPSSAKAEDKVAWQSFLDRLKIVDLETALTDIRLSVPLTQLVVESTWDFLVPYDLRIFKKVVTDRKLFPLTTLYHHLFQSTNKDIHVVTPNYDRIAEYAADAGGLCHYTGFSYGYLRNRATEPEPRIYFGSSPARVVNVWKVHGSFDWFRDRDGIVVALPIMGKRPVGLEPVIVTPGIEKYRLTHDEPFRSIAQGSDSALQTASSYLCIGYGFNDPHLQTKLVERCRDESVLLALLTKAISPSTLAFLKSGKCKRYLALEEYGAGSKMFTAEYPNGVELPDKQFWKLDQFLTMVTA
jgi:hypothetical protein